MEYFTRPMRMFSVGKLRGDLWKLTLKPPCDSMMRQELHAVACSKENKRKGKNNVCIVAKNHGEYVGWACVCCDDPYPRIMIYVKPKYRRLGVGSTLFARSKSYLKNKYYITFFRIAPWNKQAEVFFKKRGCNTNYVASEYWSWSKETL